MVIWNTENNAEKRRRGVIGLLECIYEDALAHELEIRLQSRVKRWDGLLFIVKTVVKRITEKEEESIDSRNWGGVDRSSVEIIVMIIILREWLGHLTLT